MRWSTTPKDNTALTAAAAASPSSSGVPSISSGHGREGRGDWTAGRRGVLRVALDQLGDDGCCREAAKEKGVARGRSGGGGGGDRGGGRSLAPRRHPEAVPACLLGALMPPVRLTCLPCVFTPSKSGKKKPSGLEVQGFPKVGISQAGEVEMQGMMVGRGEEGWEGGWAVSTSSSGGDLYVVWGGVEFWWDVRRYCRRGRGCVLVVTFMGNF